MSKVKYRRRKKSNRIGMLSVSLVVLIIIGVFSVKSLELQTKAQGYRYKEAKLTKQLEAETDRSQELREREKYMQTKKFIEEYAEEKLGLVYPNEIIFKSRDK